MKKIVLSLALLVISAIAFADPYLDVMYTGYSNGAYRFTLVNYQNGASDFSVTTSNGVVITSIDPGTHGNVDQGTAPAGSSTFLMYGAYVSSASFTFLNQGINTWEGQNPTPTTVTTFTDLPVTLVSFTAQVNNGNVNFAWKTMMESNVSHYEIWNVTDSSKHFLVASIHTLASNGNSSNPLNYSFTLMKQNIVTAGFGVVIMLGLLIGMIAKGRKMLVPIAAMVIVTAGMVSCSKTNVAVKVVQHHEVYQLQEIDRDNGRTVMQQEVAVMVSSN